MVCSAVAAEAAASDTEEIKTGYFVILENKSTVTLTGTLYLMLINNNKIPFTIAPGEVFSIYAGKLSDRLTAEEKAISDMAGQIFGVAVQVTALAFGIEIPQVVIDAIKKIPTLIIDATDTCLSGYSFVFKNKFYEYQFGNGCKNQWFSFRPSNFGTELAVYDINEVPHKWGNVTRVAG